MNEKTTIPTWAKAAIIAIEETDDCDLQTDYHGVRRKPMRILAWSKHTRDLFPEMRKAAGKFPPTRHLARNVKANEHRENYSMGGGMYLKAGSRYSTGWQVRKIIIEHNPFDIESAIDEGRIV